MTRAKAAQICQAIKFILDREDYSEEVEEALDMAIEALEQEETLQNLTKPNKSDLIVKDAGEIKDGLYNIKDGKLFQYKANGGTVRTYPIVSADRPKWIPCSERLPKEPRGNWEIENYLTCNEDGNIYILSWANGWNCCFNSDGSLYKDQVITDIAAWMPLPEAYKESDE